MSRSFHIVTLGCPKNQVDSDKLAGTLLADGLVPAGTVDEADLVVVNTCAFIEEARAESVETILVASQAARPDSELVVTGCMAERYGAELAEALPEISAVRGFGQPVSLGPTRSSRAVPELDLLNLPRPPASAPWAYVKIAEGCDRACGFCAIPTFRGKQRSRTMRSVLDEVEALAAGGVREIVLVAQDLASYGRDQGRGERRLTELVAAVAERVPRVRLLYLYPSDLTDALVDAICATGLPYFDLSLQHVSPALVRRMRRWGDGDRFLRRIAHIRRRAPDAALRSSFIVGYPGETEDDHDALLRFVAAADLDWAGFFAYSREDGTYASDLDRVVEPGWMAERLAEARGLQDGITRRKRDELVGSVVEALVDEPGVARSHREAPEIDGIIEVPRELAVGELVKLRIVGAAGTDLEAEVA